MSLANTPLEGCCSPSVGQCVLQDAHPELLMICSRSLAFLPVHCNGHVQGKMLGLNIAWIIRPFLILHCVFLSKKSMFCHFKKPFKSPKYMFLLTTIATLLLEGSLCKIFKEKQQIYPQEENNILL